MTNEKRTVAMKFDTAIALLNEYLEMTEDTAKREEIESSIAEMEDRKEKAAKKSNGVKKPSVASVENPKLANELYEIMEDGVKYTATQVSTLGIEKITSASKATTILKILLEDGRVVNVKEKGASLYSKA